MDDIEFLIDEVQEENTKELTQIMNLLHHPSLQKDSYVLRQFTKAILYASLHKPHHEGEKSQAMLQPSVLMTVLPGKLQITKLPSAEYHPSIPKAPLPPSSQQVKDVTSPSFPEASAIPPFPQPAEPIVKSYTVIADKQTHHPYATAEVDQTYQLHEPFLYPPDLQVLAQVKEELKKKKELQGEALQELIKKWAKKQGIPAAEELLEKIRYYVVRDARLGKIEPLLRDKYVEKVICNGFQEPVKVMYVHQELQTNITFEKEELSLFVEDLLLKTNPQGEKSIPVLDYTAGNLRMHMQRQTKLTSPKFTITKVKK